MSAHSLLNYKVLSSETERTDNQQAQLGRQGKPQFSPSPGCLLPEDAAMLRWLERHLGLMDSLQLASPRFCFADLQTPGQAVSPVHAGQNPADFDENQKLTCFLLIWAPPTFC